MEGPASFRSFGAGVGVGVGRDEAEEEAGTEVESVFTLLRAWEMACLMNRAATALSTTVVRATKETISSVRSFVRMFKMLRKREVMRRTHIRTFPLLFRIFDFFKVLADTFLSNLDFK